jgi:two-component system, OmpR family, response regulator RegX3
VLESVVEVEGAVERLRGQLQLGILLEELAQIEALVPGAEGVSLHEPVRLVPGQPGFDEGQQDPLAEDEAVRRIEIRPHSLRVHDETIDKPGEAVEHVIEREERVGYDHALGARVRDVPLVPKRDVLEADRRRRAHNAGEPRETLRDDRIPLVRHRRRPLLAAAERLLHLSHLRSRQVADLGGEALERRRAHGKRRQKLGMPVARDDLRGNRLRHEAEPGACDPLDLWIAAAIDADGAGDLADADAGQGVLHAVRVTLELEGPAGELRAEGDGLGVHPVSAADHDRCAMLFGTAYDGGERGLEPLQDQAASFSRLQREGGVEHVGGGQAEVEPASVVPELTGDRVDECSEVVVGSLFDFGNALGRRRNGSLADALDGIGGDSSDLAPALQRGQLDLEPAGELALVRPDVLHGRAGVARDHRLDSRARGGWPDGKPTAGAVRIVIVTMVSKKRVLVIEDERPIAEPLADALRREGFDVQIAATATDGLEAFSARVPDIVLLDVMLPDGDGRDVLRQIRQASRVPVLMVSARGEEMDRVLGLELGADDYVTKPFSAAELVARMRAVLRRSAAEPVSASGGALESGDVAMNLDTRTVTRGGEVVELTVKEFELLRVLIESAGRLVKRDDLVSEVWEPNWFGSTKTLDVHISSLRKKLGDDPAAPRYIHTVRGVGFRFSSADELQP